MEELKPCPFCGGKAELSDWELFDWENGTTIRCMNCGAGISENVEDGNGWHERVVGKWNCRVQSKPPKECPTDF